jgi:hypothetical protein
MARSWRKTIAIPMEGGIAANAMATSVDSTGKSAASAVMTATIVAEIEMAGDAIAMNVVTGTAIEAEIGTGIGTIAATATGTIFARGGIASRLMTATGTAGIRSIWRVSARDHRNFAKIASTGLGAKK